MMKMTIPTRQLLPKRGMLPRVALPRVRVDFPQEVTPPWQEIEVERVVFTQLKPEWFILRVVFASELSMLMTKK